MEEVWGGQHCQILYIIKLFKQQGHRCNGASLDLTRLCFNSSLNGGFIAYKVWVILLNSVLLFLSEGWLKYLALLAELCRGLLCWWSTSILKNSVIVLFKLIVDCIHCCLCFPLYQTGMSGRFNHCRSQKGQLTPGCQHGFGQTCTAETCSLLHQIFSKAKLPRPNKGLTCRSPFFPPSWLSGFIGFHQRISMFFY